MVRVERACPVYVVSAILALADARSVFDVAGFDSSLSTPAQAPGKTRAAPQAGLPVSHACHSGPARGPRGLSLAPIDALASMSPPSHMFHSCPQNV